MAERMLTETLIEKVARPTSGRVIYVSVPAAELRDAWQRLVNDLVGAGHVVLPAEARLPDAAAQADEAINADLARSEVSVHFLGDSEGMKPEGSEEGIVRRQIRLAREHASKAGAFPTNPVGTQMVTGSQQCQNGSVRGRKRLRVGVGG